MNLLILRTILVYFLIILAMRLMGKKQLGELQPSELVSTILISNLASISIESPELPLLGSIIPVFIIVSLEILVSAICLHNRKLEKLVSGSPKVIIKDGVLDTAMLHELRFTADDLLEALRGKDIFNISEVNYAVVEPNGSVSTFKNFEYENVKNNDMKIHQTGNGGVCVPIILNGEIIYENLRYINKDENWINSQIKQSGTILKNILLMQSNKDAQNVVIKVIESAK